jgi:polyadenylate-binding protein
MPVSDVCDERKFGFRNVVRSKTRFLPAVTRESLGYAYVNFQTPADAEKATQELNYALIKGRACRIMWSQRDPSIRRNNVGNIFVKNLGPEITTKELYETFKLFGNILSCKVASDSRGSSKGYGFVHFESEKAGQAAIEGVNGMEWGGRTVVCMPYVPRAQRSGPEWTNLFVKNVPAEWTQKTLYDVFAPYGEIISSVLTTDETGRSRGFGFVCYKDHLAALAAETELNNKVVEGTPASLPPFPIKEKDGEEAVPASNTLNLFVGRAQKKAERERSKKDAQDAARRDRLQKWQGCNLYVRNLDESVDDAMLRKEFSKFGTITSAVVARDKEGRSRLFGYVCFGSAEESAKALADMNRKMLQGKPLYVQLWQPKEARQATVVAAQRTAARAAPTAGAAANALAAVNPALAAVLNNPALAAARAGAAPDLAQLQQLFTLMMMQAAQGNRMVPGVAGQARPGAPGPVQVAGGRPPVAGFPPQLAGFPFPQQQQLMQLLAAGALNNHAVPANAANAAAARAPKKQATTAAAPQRNAATPAQQKSAVAAGRGSSKPGAARSGDSTAPGAMQYVTAARNVAESTEGTTASVPAPVAAVPVAPVQSFATQLAAATPVQRKQMIGERLFSQIASKEAERAAKITGMLLEAMDEGELLHLLESPADLGLRIGEALSVLGVKK